MSKLLVLGSNHHVPQLDELVNAYAKDYDVFVIHGDSVFLDSLDENIGSQYKKGIPHPKTFGDWFFFALFAPFLALFLFFRLISYKFKKFDTLLLTSTAEKLTLTPWAKLLGYKVFWYENAFYDERFKITLFAPLFSLYSRMSTLICRSQAIAEELTTTYKVKQKNIVNLPFGIDLSHIAEQTDIYTNMVAKDYQIKNEALFIIGFIGELTVEDGIEYLLKSIEYFRELIPDFQIIIVGDGPQKKSLVWLTKMLHLDQHVRFVGKQDNLSRWFNYFNVFIYPRTTKVEYAPQVAQAMAAGIPVVTTNVDGVCEIVNHQGGITVAPKTTEKLAEAIFQLYNDKEDYEMFAKQAKTRIQKEYDLEVIKKKFVDLVK